MSFVNSMMSQAAKGFAIPNRYSVEILLGQSRDLLNDKLISLARETEDPLEPWSSGLEENKLRHIMFNCAEANIPGIGLATNEIRYVGPIRKIPYTKILDDITLTFYCSRDHAEYKFFKGWMDLIIDEKDYTVEYYNNYIATMQISQLTKKDQRSMTLTINEVYPITINAIPLSYSEQNNIERVSVVFARR